MTPVTTIALLPLLAPALAIVLILLSLIIRRRQATVFGLSVAGLLAALAGCGLAARVAPVPATLLLVVDPFGLYVIGLLALTGLAILLFSYDYWAQREGRHEEYYLLLLLGMVGAMVLAVSAHFAALFLGLELLSLANYVLAAYVRRSRLGTEAGLKYLVLAGVSSAFLLFGMALVYAELGTMQLGGLVAALQADGAAGPLVVVGLGMILVGLGFKLALFPFSLWAPDVFQGAPAVVTAFIATVSKAAVFALLVRVFLPWQASAAPSFPLLFSVLAVASMFAGNLLALLQGNLKRLLAYSSVAHFGYLLVAFLAGGGLGLVAVAFYLTMYLVTTLGAFGVMAMLSGREGDAEEIDDYRGLAWRHPWLAGVLTACLLSLAGLPLTAGFVGKFLLITSGVGASLWALVILLVINSALSIFYYLRVVRALFRTADEAAPALPPAYSWLGGITLAVLAVLLCGLGVYPAPLLAIIERMSLLAW